MGRSVYADEVGTNKGDTWVHKFWFAVQPSEVNDYLDAYEPGYLMAQLDVSQEAAIRERVAELKAEFLQQFGVTYQAYMDSGQPHEASADASARKRGALASRIDLGKNLLATIANMNAAGVTCQELTIEC